MDRSGLDDSASGRGQPNGWIVKAGKQAQAVCRPDGLRGGHRVRRFEPLVRDLGEHAVAWRSPDDGGETFVQGPEVIRNLTQHMLAGVERLAGKPGRVRPTLGPRVVEIERGAVVDGLRLAVPHQQVRVGPGAVDVGRERIQPQDHRGLLGRRRV